MSVEFGLKVSVFCPFTPTAHFHQPAMPNARNFHGAKYYTTEPKSFHQFSGKSAQICKFSVSYKIRQKLESRGRTFRGLRKERWRSSARGLSKGDRCRLLKYKGGILCCNF